MKLKYIAAAAVIAGLLIDALVMWCLCRAAAGADMEMEEMEEEYDEE